MGAERGQKEDNKTNQKKKKKKTDDGQERKKDNERDREPVQKIVNTTHSIGRVRFTLM